MKAQRMIMQLAATVAALAAFPVKAVEITGAGATFPAPIYAKWADAYQRATGNKVSYQSIGSGAGIKQIEANTVDFGASEMPLKTEDLEKGGMVQFPAVIGGVVPVVNLPGVKPGQMKLTGQVLADIYLGKVEKWTDPEIAKLNPGMQLPDQDIAVVRRADGSGTSFLFTNYLSKVSPEWKQKVGEGISVQWPLGLGGKGNEGVSAFVQRIPASLGYVEYAYAQQNKLNHTQLQNADGVFVRPDEASFQAAAGTDWTKSAYSEILTNRPGKQAWPITGATFILMYKAQNKPAQAVEVLKFFEWAYKNGDKMATELGYIPLPDSLVALVHKTWAANIKDRSGKALWTAK